MKANVLLRNAYGLLGLFIVTLLFSPIALAQQAGPVLASSSEISSKALPEEKSSLRTLSEDGTAYTASNGAVYKKGGTIALGSGKGGNGSFLHSGTMMFGNPNTGLPLLKDATGAEFEILEIRQEKIGKKRVYAVVKDGTIKHGIFIESALAAAEIK